MRARFVTLADGIEEVVREGDKVAFEGFTHLIPFAAGHEAIRQRRRNLELVRMTPDLIYDQMVGCGMARRLVFSWCGNPGVGSLHRIREAIEQTSPAPLEIEEHSHAGMAAAYDAGAANLPFAVLRGYRGVDLAKFNSNVRSITCPFTGEELAAIPAMRLDAAVIHAQQADEEGNVLIEGIIGVQKEAALCAKRVLVTVEEKVQTLRRTSPNACILPSWTLSAIAVVPGGAFPSYAHGYYVRNNAFYVAWDKISRDRDSFDAWVTQNIMNKTPDHFATYPGAKNELRRGPHAEIL
jgi:glutaconate CoA-transferase, subunit A